VTHTHTHTHTHKYTHTQLAKRKELAAGPLPEGAKKLEAILQKNGYKFSAGDDLTISDLVLYGQVWWLNVSAVHFVWR
jgi:hypothetical protein